MLLYNLQSSKTSTCDNSIVIAKISHKAAETLLNLEIKQQIANLLFAET